MKHDVNQIPIFVSSADSYQDIWPAFFTLFKRNWPQYKGRIFLNTQTLEYTHEGLDIVSTKLGPQRLFGETFKKGLDCLPSDDFLLLMIDYFFEAPVDVDALQHYYEVFKRSDIDTLTLNPNPSAVTCPVFDESHCLRIVNRPSRRVMFGYQAAFWKRATLKRFVLDFETPWRSEFYGSQRFAKSPAIFYCLSDVDAKPIKYDESGVLHGGGRWYDPALKRLDFKDVPLDIATSKRLHYKPSQHPKLDYIIHELHHSPSRIRSMWSVLRWPNSGLS